jgi:hypothetical protein
VKRHTALTAAGAVATAAALFLAACSTQITQSSNTTTTTSTIVKPGQRKPIDLFAHVGCQGGLAFSSLTWGMRQGVVCIRKWTVLTLNLGTPAPGDHWGVSEMRTSTNGNVVAIQSSGKGGRYSFVYRAVRPGIDFVHVLMVMPCPKGGCIPEGPPVPEAQWVIRVVPAPSPYPATLTMSRGLTFSNESHHLPWGTTLTPAQARWVKLQAAGPDYSAWGVWDPHGYPNTYPVRSTNGGATWTAAGPQLASDWAGGSLYYVSKVLPESSTAVVMVSDSVIDVTTDGGQQWYQYQNGVGGWTMTSCDAAEVSICLRISPASYTTLHPKNSYADYLLNVAQLRWQRIRRRLS